MQVGCASSICYNNSRIQIKPRIGFAFMSSSRFGHIIGYVFWFWQLVLHRWVTVFRYWIIIKKKKV